MKVLQVDSLEELYRTEHERLWKSLLAFTGDPEVASEAESEAYKQALARGDQLRNPKAWLWTSSFKIARGLLAGKQTGARAENSIHGLDDEMAIKTSVPLDSSLVDFLDLLTTLSDQQRAAVVLRYAGGFKPTEIAELLGSTPGSIRVQLHRAHQHLRERLEHQ